MRLVAGLALLGTISAGTASAQLTAAVSPSPVLLPVGLWGAVSPAASPTGTLSLVVNSGAFQSIASIRDKRVNAFPSPVSITTRWDLTTPATIVLVGYFATSSAALSSGSDAIPAAYVSGRMRSGVATAFTPFTQNAVSGVGTGGASLLLFRQSVVPAVNGIGQRVDDLDLRLDLRSSPTLASGSYTGTLTLRAVAY